LRPWRPDEIASRRPRKEAGLTEALDSALKERLRAVLDRRPVTEWELRKLTEESDAVALILSGQLEASEQRLAELSSDPASSLADIAATLRRTNELRRDADELDELLAALQLRAREFRASWLS
jgi:hypothetical protein